MNFARLKEAVRLCAAAKVSSLCWGHRGIGKSDAIRQLCLEGNGQDGLPMGFIDFRLSQIEASDLRGLPDKSQGRTIYLPPNELPIGDLDAQTIESKLSQIEDKEERRISRIQMQHRYKKGILFLDEPNRAEDNVLQSVFQLILDRQIGHYVLPAGWAIVLAANYMEGDYITNGFTDSALLDRMCHLHLVAGEETLDDWCTYMAEQHGENAERIIQFCASNIDYMVGQPTGELGFTTQPSPRSWDKAATVLRITKEQRFSDEAKRVVLQGLVGMECAIAFEQFACPIQPRDLIEHGVAAYKDKLAALQRNEVMGVSWGLISMIRNKMDEPRYVKIALDVAEVLINSRTIADKDIVLAYLRALISGTEDEIAITSCITNLELAQQVVELADDANLLLKSLFERPKLHKKLSAIGWGSSIQ